LNRLKLNRSGEQQIISDGPKIISVLSGKGGVGKSVIAYNLADRIASRGNDVLLVDTDLDCGSIHVLANSSPECGIAEYMTEHATLKDATYAINDRLSILGSVDQDVMSELSDTAQTARFVARLRQDAAHYGYVIIDHESGKSASSVVITQGSDLSLLVLVPELMSISDCYGLFKCLVNTNPQTNCKLLINRAKDTEESIQLSREFNEMCRKFLGRSPALIGFLEESADFTASVASQKPLAAVCDKQASVLQALDGIVSEITTNGISILRPDEAALKQQINNEPITADIKG